MHAIVEKYSESFGIGYEHLKTTNVTKLHIDTGEAAPIYCKPYGGLSFQDLAILKDDLGQMVKHGIMQPTLYVTGEQANGWAFPCRYV
ncbi:hypothetical protein DM01DRAFT_1338520 [Hesseltinella vesiculosa]|uniref:Uncharacterized protein n=1 Tax=Hesseltinella vesiculosa TaxID=101127 RepID=A0A1X2GA79_9FUNG|nr:hypothetical protein DM01DRAFT_1338520 [Hesseltinella vesiculosa]